MIGMMVGIIEGDFHGTKYKNDENECQIKRLKNCCKLKDFCLTRAIHRFVYIFGYDGLTIARCFRIFFSPLYIK